MDNSEWISVIIVILRPELAKIRDRDWDRYQEVGRIRDWDPEDKKFEISLAKPRPVSWDRDQSRETETSFVRPIPVSRDRDQVETESLADLW